MRSSLMLALVLLGSAGLAHADTINTFNLSGSLVDGSFGGTVTLNETTGLFTGSSFRVITSTSSATYTGAPVSTTVGSTQTSNVFASANSIDSFDMILPYAALRDYSGGSLCTVAAPCSGRYSGLEFAGIPVDGVTSATLTLVQPAAVTPEPPSVLLLGTGVLLLGVFIRRHA